MRARSFSDDTGAATTEAKPEPEYAFDGFEVEFSVKIALTPPTPPKTSDPGRREDAT
jgi:hypothetical protein